MSVKFFGKIAFWSWDTPLFCNRDQHIDFCDLIFKIDKEKGIYWGLTTLKWPKIAIVGILHRLEYEFSQKEVPPQVISILFDLVLLCSTLFGFVCFRKKSTLVEQKRYHLFDFVRPCSTLFEFVRLCLTLFDR